MSNSVLRMTDTSVRDVSELPIFAEGKIDNIKIALARGIFNKPTYFYANDLDKLGYIDSNLQLHVNGGEDGNNTSVQRVKTLPAAEDAKDNVIYIFNKVAYLYNDGVYDPLATDYSTVIENIQLDIRAINGLIEGINDRLAKVESSTSPITERANVSQFPAIGEPNHTYISLSENASYRWDSENLRYVCTGRDYTAIKEINGGSASININ